MKGVRTETQGEPEFRAWDELVPDVLGLIFKNLPLPQVLQVITTVCKPWCKAVEGPYCWEKIDLACWIPGRDKRLDPMLRMLVTRSFGSLRELNVSWINDDQLSFISDHVGGSFQILALRYSFISDSMVERVAPKLSSVTTLDLSYCNGMTARAFKAIGTNCKALESLSWNMHQSWPTYDPVHLWPNNVGVPPSRRFQVHGEVGLTIARTMPNLKNLSIAYLKIGTSVIHEILSGCPKLKNLNIRGCWNIEEGPNGLNERYPELTVVWVYYDTSDEDEDEEYDYDYDDDDDEEYEYGDDGDDDEDEDDDL